jgi:hypothetical protein
MVKPIRGGSQDDDYRLFIKALTTGASLCLDCLALRTGLTRARAEEILATFALGLKTHPQRQPCASCGQTKMTYWVA